ncbi:MAG: c-type cytochrome [Thermodesulfobacteriota bacterium]
MKHVGLMIFALVLSAVVMTGCTGKKQPAEKAKEVASQIAESVDEKPAGVKKPAEVKEAVPLPAAGPEEKVVEKKAVAPSVAEEKAPQKPAVNEKSVEAGAAIFKSKCSPCHGADGKGTAMAPAFKGNVWIKGADKGQIAAVIRNGRKGPAKRYTKFAISMPAQKALPDSDVDALVEYIKSIN